MLASFRNEFVLLSNPKSGTTAYEDAFGKFAEVHVGGTPKWKHLNYYRMRQHFGDIFERANCTILTVVRDPIETVESWYKYRTRKGLSNPKHKWHHRYAGDISFEQFVEEWNARSSKRAEAPSSVNFCFNENDELAPSTYIHYSNIDDLRKVLSQKVGKDVKVPPKNISPKRGVEYDRSELMKLPRFQEAYEKMEKIPFFS